MPAPTFLIGPFIQALKWVYQPFASIRRNKGLRGYYLLHHQGQSSPIVNSPEGIPNFVKIDIDFFNPSLLTIKSKDYDKRYSRTWKTWNGRIIMDDKTHGKGYYHYVETVEPGDHEIWITSPGIITVRITDKGVANLKEGKDNISATQQWRRIEDNDPRINTFKQMFQ